jgi:hypothetical protein
LVAVNLREKKCDKKTIYFMTKCFLIILAGLFVVFNGQSKNTNSDSTPEDPIKVIQEREQRAVEKQTDNLGELISTIEFGVHTDNKSDFEDGIIPWASLQNPESDIPNLIDKDEVIIKQASIKIIIDYPLTNQYEFTLNSDKGFTRAQLLSEISRHYYKIFDEEEESATVKTVPIDERTAMYNRNETNGKYGIWGHDIADLVLSSISVYKTRNGETVLSLDIES